MKSACAALLALVLLGGCERTFRDMYDQPRYKPLAQSPLWPDGRASRTAPEGVVAHSEGTFAGTSSGRGAVASPAPEVGPFDVIRPELRPDVTGSGPGLAAMAGVRAPIDGPSLARGRERFDIFCAPCHSLAGDGDGMIARRGFPHPPSFHTDRLRAAPDAHLYAVITDGYGAMHAYATRVPPADRLAIIGYIRALQFSQHAPLAALAAQDRDQLRTAPTAKSLATGASR